MQSKDVQETDSSIRSRAKEILGTPEHREMATLVAHLFQMEEAKEKETAKIQYRFCYKNFPNSITLKLLNVYRCSLYGHEVRSQSISLLYSLLTHLDYIRFSFSPFALSDIKPVLISCLVLQEIPETDFKILSRIAYRLTLEVFMSDNNGWKELSECISTLADYNVERALFVFRDLPAVLDDDFLLFIQEKIFPEIMTRLDNIHHGSLKDWILGLESGFNMAVQLSEKSRRDLIGNIEYAILKSLYELVREGMEDIAREGLEALVLILQEEAVRYYEAQSTFVRNFLTKVMGMKGIGEDTKNILKKAFHILRDKCFEASWF